MEEDNGFRSEENAWVFQRYGELLNAPKHRLGDYRTFPADVVYLISTADDDTQLYVGMTTQKGGRQNAHIRDKRDGMRQRMKKRCEDSLRRVIEEDDLQRIMSELWFQWIVEPDRGRQERVEHLALALRPPILNVIGRAKWRTRGRAATQGIDGPRLSGEQPSTRQHSAVQARNEEQESTSYDRDTSKNFSITRLQILAEVRRDLGDEATRSDVRKWFRLHKDMEYAPAWIVKNRFIVRKNERGAGGVCILDPRHMPDRPFPKIRTVRSRASNGLNALG